MKHIVVGARNTDEVGYGRIISCPKGIKLVFVDLDAIENCIDEHEVKDYFSYLPKKVVTRILEVWKQKQQSIKRIDVYEQIIRPNTLGDNPSVEYADN